MAQDFWTPRLVDRTPAFSQPSQRNVYWLILKVNLDEKRDTFSFEVDGISHSWHRRGMPYFTTRQKAVDYVAEKGNGFPISI